MEWCRPRFGGGGGDSGPRRAEACGASAGDGPRCGTGRQQGGAPVARGRPAGAAPTRSGRRGWPRRGQAGGGGHHAGGTAGAAATRAGPSLQPRTEKYVKFPSCTHRGREGRFLEREISLPFQLETSHVWPAAPSDWLMKNTQMHLPACRTRSPRVLFRRGLSPGTRRSLKVSSTLTTEHPPLHHAV